MFRPSEAGWDEIELPYRRFSDEERDKLRAIVNKYLDWRRFEPAAVLIADRVSEIGPVSRAARELKRALSNLMGGPDKPNKAARLDTALAIEREWPGSGGLVGNNLDAILLLSHALELACEKAKATSTRTRFNEKTGKEIPPGGTRTKDGNAWDSMVNALAAFVEGCGLKVSVNKGQRAEADFKSSAFVAFIRAIENHYPQGIPMRSTTAHGLSSAISEVLRASKRGKFRAR
jgi:hypothetical protein